MKLINKKELGILLGISQKTIYNLMQKDLPHIMIGGSVRFDEDDIKEYIDNKKK